MSNTNVATPVITPVSGTVATAEKSVRLPQLLGGLVTIVAASDLCFWKLKSFGSSTALFFIVLATILLIGHRKRRSTPKLLVALILLGGAAVAAILQNSATNTFVFLVLTLLIAGETNFGSIASTWSRLLAQTIALVRAPGRVFWLAGKILQNVFACRGGLVGRPLSAILLCLPALILALIFGRLLTAGNALFGIWIGGFFDWLEQALAVLLDLPRLSLWASIAFVTLPLLRPVYISDWWWRWTQTLPRFPEGISPQAAFFSSGLVLVVLNGLFFVANLADLLSVWPTLGVTSGTTDSRYVHQGVDALIWTVLTSALVLLTIFQFAENVTRRPALRRLGLLWVAQNVFLIFSVFLRLKFYVATSGLSLLRIGVCLFLLLVAAGYFLLAVKILHEKSLSWLIGRCLLATFVLFYVNQFLDLSAVAANYNVAAWENDRTRPLDVYYLEQLGPSAWPALQRAHKIAPNVVTCDWIGHEIAGDRLELRSWREFSLWAWQEHRALNAGSSKPN